MKKSLKSSFGPGHVSVRDTYAVDAEIEHRVMRMMTINQVMKDRRALAEQQKTAEEQQAEQQKADDFGLDGDIFASIILGTLAGVGFGCMLDEMGMIDFNMAEELSGIVSGNIIAEGVFMAICEDRDPLSKHAHKWRGGEYPEGRRYYKEFAAHGQKSASDCKKDYQRKTDLALTRELSLLIKELSHLNQLETACRTRI
jgi:hypothetical protein